MQEVSATQTAPTLRRAPIRSVIAWTVGALVVLAYFLYFVWPGLSGRFAEDDMMNIYYYWSRGPWKLVKGLFLFFTTYYRPMGGVFYSLLYHFFGLNPFPYHVAITVLLLVNTYLAYRVAVLISGSRLLGGLTALLSAYQAQIAWMVFVPSLVYDVLCYTFFFLALNYYLAIRQRGERLNWKQVIVFLLLYIAALDSKEMAVSLPLIVLLYEAIWHAPVKWRWPGVRAWAQGAALPSLTAGFLTAVYIVGKSIGPEALSKIDAYKPVFTWTQYVDSTSKFLNTFFYQPLFTGFFRGSVKVVLTWVVLFYIASRLKRKHFTLMVWLVILSPLPITFISGRGGSCLYIPLVGWAILVSTLFLSLGEVIAREPVLRRVPAQITRGVLVAIGVALVWRETIHQNTKIMPSFEAVGPVTASVMRQLKEMQPTVRPHSKVIFLNNVFEGWDVKFIAELTFRDHTVNVWLQDKSHLPQDQINSMDYVFEFQGGKLVRLKAPA